MFLIVSFWLVVEPTHIQMWVDSSYRASWYLQPYVHVSVSSQAADCRRSAYSTVCARWHSARHASCVSW